MAIRTNADVAAEVRAYAAKSQTTAVHLASVLGISTMSMSRRLRGHIPFTPEELIKVSDALNVPVSAFFGTALDAA